METREVLTFLVGGSGGLIKQATTNFTDEQWVQRALPGTNPPGFIVWHMARTVDWAVQCGVRGVPEVAAGEAFGAVGVELGIGTGITPEEAMDIARRIPRDLVAEYAAAVIRESLDWLATASNDELESPTGMAEHQAAFPVYRAEGHLREVDELLSLPNWQVLARPASIHIRRHTGELDVLAQALKSS